MADEDRREIWQALALLGGLVGLFLLMRSLGLEREIPVVRAWIATQGVFAPLLFILIYATAVAFFVPGTLMSLSGAALFGPVVGVAVVSTGGILGATLAFLLARYVARDQVTRWMSKSRRFEWLQEQTRIHGAPIVAITRLLPVIPANLLHYAFGITAVPLGVYVFWSWVCMLPGTILYVVGMEALHEMIVTRHVPWSMVGVFLGTASLLAALVVWAKRAARKAGEPASEAEAASGA